MKDFVDQYSFMDEFEEDVEFLPLISIEEDDNIDDDLGDVINILPIRNTVLFPGVVIPITIGRDKSIQAIKDAYKENKIIGVISQKDSAIEDPDTEDLNQVGTIARIAKTLKMPDGSTTAIIQGKRRFQVEKIVATEPYHKATFSKMIDTPAIDDREFQATISSLKDLAGQIIKLSPNIPSEANMILKNIDNDTFLINFITSNLNADVAAKQQILEENDLAARAEMLLKYLDDELQMQELKNKIQSKVRTDIEKQQKDFFLTQQMKTIQEELGGDAFDVEIGKLQEKAAKKQWSKTVSETFDRELEKLQRMNPAAAEYSVIHNYLELLLDLPWEDFSEDSFDLDKASKVLQKDHYGLDKVEERILEYLAVLQLKGDMKSPILCLVGPPGVGKTSLGRSIASALNREYVRISLGGLHDESEIRGHRKTYIGAMPGRIIQSLKKAGTSNPVFILDEIDKVGADFRGDPSSALLEVLDPEQNSTFYDNFLELEYDLSKVMFIATANSLNSIQPALRDRIEVINLEGYAVEEKVEIAKRHLLPKQLAAHGLKSSDVKLGVSVLKQLIEDYTRESGVRELDRKLAAIMRNVAKKVAMKEKRQPAISESQLAEILGIKRYDKEAYQGSSMPGVAVGLAWTYTGGEILFIESNLSKGKGGLTLTGNLGDVMKESATTALSFLKAHAKDLGLNPDVFANWNIHIHIPEGAIPKDGPSAGVTMLTALASLFTQRKVKPYLAMTGEITLRGKVLPVGGIKEKILAAKRAGIKEILLCETNRKDIDEINSSFIKGIKFHYVERMEQVLDFALTSKRVPGAIDVNK
jgi:ATP-dependent Lon protease